MKSSLLIFIGLSLVSRVFATEAELVLDHLGVMCIKDPSSQEWSNSFLVKDGTQSVLVDAGWGPTTSVPQSIESDLNAATKVATHFHYDHITHWSKLEHILLSSSQQKRCQNKDSCKPNIWDTVYSAEPFQIEGMFPTDGNLPANMKYVACSGHSRVDTCFLHESSRTLFAGDLFYPGPVFLFTTGGSFNLLRSTAHELLALPHWDRLAITHGDCFVPRSMFESYVQSLDTIARGNFSWNWNFAFWLPLVEINTATGSLLQWPLQKK